MKKIVLALLLLSAAAIAQTNVVTIPSVDTLDKGQFWLSSDNFYNPSQVYGTSSIYTAYGLGNLDLGVNYESFGITQPTQGSLVPNFKWRLYSKGRLAVVVGDQFFIPVHNRVYYTMNYAYALAGVTVKHLGRVSFGGYNSQNAKQYGNSTGALLAFEHPLKNWLIPQVDWESGTNGQTSIGVEVHPTSHLNITPYYIIGNSKPAFGTNNGPGVQIQYVF